MRELDRAFRLRASFKNRIASYGYVGCIGQGHLFYDRAFFVKELNMIKKAGSCFVACAWTGDIPPLKNHKQTKTFRI